MDLRARIFVAGDDRPIGRAIRERLAALGFTGVIPREAEPDLRDAGEVERFFANDRPEYVFLTAGRSAGIAGNQDAPADLMIDNLRVAAHVIPAAWNHPVKKLLYLASSCTYPRLAPQPLQVSSLWTGSLEPTSASYAVAKLAGMQLCRAYRQQHRAAFVSAIGADPYGPGDDFSPERSHVVAALIRRMHEAQASHADSVTVWGTGMPRREFIYVDDLADACIFAMRQYDGDEPLNLGTGVTTSIAELAEIIRQVVGYSGALQFDASRPDGTPLKGLDSHQLHAMGWRPGLDLVSGLEITCRWYRESVRDS